MTEAIVERALSALGVTEPPAQARRFCAEIGGEKGEYYEKYSAKARQMARELDKFKSAY